MAAASNILAKLFLCNELKRLVNCSMGDGPAVQGEDCRESAAGKAIRS